MERAIDGVSQRSVARQGDNEAGAFLPGRIYTWARFVVFRLFRFSLVDRGTVRRAAPRRAAPLLLSGIAAGNGIDRSIPSCLVVRDFPREEKGTLTRQYIPLKLFRNGRGIKRTAGRDATLNYHPRGYGKIIAANDESVPAIYRFLSYFSLFPPPLLYHFSSSLLSRRVEFANRRRTRYYRGKIGKSIDRFVSRCTFYFSCYLYYT